MGSREARDRLIADDETPDWLALGAGAGRGDSAEARRLLAHELAHVIQQTGGNPRAAAAPATAATATASTPADLLTSLGI